MTPTLAEVTRQLLMTYNRFPRKRLGQHFLIDPQVVARIISAAELGPDDLVIEIGSGLGTVTAELAKNVHHLIAVEIDQELMNISKKVLEPLPNISFVNQDILKTSLAELALGRRYKLVGNLPYYITSPIIEKILEGEEKPETAVVMTQKEVAERMVAGAGTKNYGSFSIFCQFYAEVKLNSLVSKSSFLPWPEVSSAVVVLKPYKTAKYPVKDIKLFFDLVHAAFQQRRKKLSNSLKPFGLTNSPVDLNRRPETVSIEEFAAIVSSL